jgi:hypothetical protein
MSGSNNQFWQEEVYEPMYVPKDLVLSPAFAAIKTAAAHRVLMVFYTKRDMRRKRQPCHREKVWRCVNNGQITFSYKEAFERYGLTASRFRNALDTLVRLGFIDIAHSGYGLRKDQTLYAISRRWQRYGTPEFLSAERPKRTQKMGFKKGNHHGKNASTENL